VGWPAFIYVAETDEQARKEFEEPFWYLAKKLLRMPREYTTWQVSGASLWNKVKRLAY
jgi:hypothetical protein